MEEYKLYVNGALATVSYVCLTLFINLSKFVEDGKSNKQLLGLFIGILDSASVRAGFTLALFAYTRNMFHPDNTFYTISLYFYTDAVIFLSLPWIVLVASVNIWRSVNTTW